MKDRVHLFLIMVKIHQQGRYVAWFAFMKGHPAAAWRIYWRGHLDQAIAVASSLVAVISEEDKGDLEPGMTVVLLQRREQSLCFLFIRIPIALQSLLPASLLPCPPQAST